LLFAYLCGVMGLGHANVLVLLSRLHPFILEGSCAKKSIDPYYLRWGESNIEIRRIEALHDLQKSLQRACFASRRCDMRVEFYMSSQNVVEFDVCELRFSLS
jgi:hypothetical protein